MSGILGHLGSRSGAMGIRSPATRKTSNTVPQFNTVNIAGQDQSPDEGVMIGISKGDSGTNHGRFGSYKVFTTSSSPYRVSTEPIYYGAFLVVVGDNGAFRFVDVVVTGMTVATVLHSIETKNDGDSSGVSRVYSGDSKLNLAMASSFKLSIFEFHGYPTAS